MKLLNKHFIIVGFLIIAGLLNANKLLAQISLPDTNFRNYLKVHYPTVINANNELDTTIAKTITGNLDCNSQRNIKNVSGVEYFINIIQLNMDGDSIAFLPNISRLTKLKRLLVDSTQIKTLPDLNNLTALQSLKVRENNLTNLPDLSQLSNVTLFYIDNNNLTTIPDLSGMSSLRIFLCADNKISSLPNLSNLTNLQIIRCENNQLKSFPSLVNSTTLNTLTFYHNQITKFPDISGLTNLTTLSVYDNLLDSIPDLNAFSNLTTAEFNSNKLTFEDIIPSSTHPNFSNFKFMPQAKVGSSSPINLIEGQTLTIDIGIDNGITTNIYKWYKNNQYIGTTSVNKLVIDNLTLGDTGQYTCTITNSNPLLSNISLSSNTVTVTVNPCISLNSLKFSVPNNNCKFPISVELDESSLIGIDGPFTYSLKNTLDTQSFRFTSPSVSVNQQGLYDITVTNSKNCSAKGQIKISRNEICEPVFYPNDNGLADTYFIELKGSAKIYNTEGDLVKTLTTPGYWNGKTNKGDDAPSGLYLIVVNENTTTKVTLIR